MQNVRYPEVPGKKFKGHLLMYIIINYDNNYVYILFHNSEFILTTAKHAHTAFLLCGAELEIHFITLRAET